MDIGGAGHSADAIPHDGVATNNITGKRYIDHWREAGFECETPIKNTGAGAAMMRVEAARRIFPNCTEKPIEKSNMRPLEK